MNTRRVPSGDHRGDESRGPVVSRRGGASPAVATTNSAVSYPSFFAFTLTRTKAMLAPSGETCRIPNPRELEQVRFL